MTNDKMIDVLMGLLTAMSLGLASFALKWQFDANAEIKVLKEQIVKMEEKSKEDIYKSTNDRQDKNIVNFWKLHSWEKGQIDELRIKEKLSLSQWPDLDR